MPDARCCLGCCSSLLIEQMRSEFRERLLRIACDVRVCTEPPCVQSAASLHKQTTSRLLRSTLPCLAGKKYATKSTNKARNNSVSMKASSLHLIFRQYQIYQDSRALSNANCLGLLPPLDPEAGGAHKYLRQLFHALCQGLIHSQTS